MSRGKSKIEEIGPGKVKRLYLLSDRACHSGTSEGLGRKGSQESEGNTNQFYKKVAKGPHLFV